MNASSIPRAAQGVVHDVAPWIERLARVGYVAKALLYLTIGGLAAKAALGDGGKTTDQRGAMKTLTTLFHGDLGRVVLATIALGLAGYALWRVVEGIADPEHRGHGAKGIAMRVKSLATGAVHAGLAISAARLALGHGVDANSSRTSEHWTARALASPGGKIAVAIVAVAFLGYGAYQLYCAVRSKLSKQLSLGQLGSTARSVVVGASRFGIASRGIVFGMIGVLFLRAVMHHDAREAGSLPKSLGALFELGRWPFVTVAIGLMAYGIYQLINARYRRIDVR